MNKTFLHGFLFVQTIFFELFAKTNKVANGYKNSLNLLVKHTFFYTLMYSQISFTNDFDFLNKFF